MNYYGPREIADAEGKGTGRWRYTVRNDDRIYAVGYCADGCPGHDSPEEACAHYKDYLLDHTLRLDGENRNEQRRCQVCGEWTNHYATIDHTSLYFLCDQHRTRDDVATLYGDVGQVISSW